MITVNKNRSSAHQLATKNVKLKEEIDKDHALDCATINVWQVLE